MAEEICPVMKALNYKNGCDIQKYRDLLPEGISCHDGKACFREYVQAVHAAIAKYGSEKLPPDGGEALRQVLETLQAA